MVCPQCGKEMRPGFLQGAQRLYFLQQRTLGPVFNPGDVIISKNYMAHADFPGFICESCGLVVFDYKHPMDRWP